MGRFPQAGTVDSASRLGSVEPDAQRQAGKRDDGGFQILVANPMDEEAEQSNGSDRTRIDERQPDTRFTPGSKGRGVLQER